jgi:sigma-B regulation protein RsbU (phosphoserine phosphatase)
MSLDLPVPVRLRPSLDGVRLHPGSDLEAARRVQQHLFPRQLPHLRGWDLAAVCQPAGIVAGDYYDLFEVTPGHVAVALGDVAGKGLGPALVMAGLHAWIRSRLPHRAADIPGLVGDLNQYLLASTPDDLFVTLFLAVLDGDTGCLRYVNAGHPGPALLAGTGMEADRLTAGGTVLGVVPGAGYEEGHAVLAPGSVLALFSDGLTEAANADGQQFGEHRVVEVLATARHEPAGVIVTRVREAVERFHGPADLADDLSLVVVHRRPV